MFRNINIGLVVMSTKTVHNHVMRYGTQVHSQAYRRILDAMFERVKNNFVFKWRPRCSGTRNRTRGIVNSASIQVLVAAINVHSNG